MNELKNSTKTTNFCRYYLKWKINFIREIYDGHNCLIKSLFIRFTINGIEHDISLRMLTF